MGQRRIPRLTDLISKDNIYISDAKSKDELFEEIFEKLYKEGLVKENFLDKLKDREKNYPTGLDMSVVDESMPNIAIPHTDPDTCEVTRIIPVKLNNELTFSNMIDPSLDLKVSVIFMILNEDGSEQTDMLAKIMDFMTKTESIEDLFKMDNIGDIYQFIEKNI